MSWRTSKILLLLRNIGRRIGLNRLILVTLGSSYYEDRFQKLMLNSIQKGDCVWDVGANIAYYTTQFSARVGLAGHVFAFEPSPVNLVVLGEKTKEMANVVVVPMALGERKGMVAFEQGHDEIGATSRVLPNTTASEGLLSIEINSGDNLLASSGLLPPNVIKIDTEGYELEVLKGLKKALQNNSLRTVCIEVHFRLLDELGFPDAPREIEKILTTAGFSLHWPDASHVMATRTG